MAKLIAKAYVGHPNSKNSPNRVTLSSFEKAYCHLYSNKKPNHLTDETSKVCYHFRNEDTFEKPSQSTLLSVNIHGTKEPWGQCYKCSMIINYSSRIVIWSIFKSGMTLEPLFTIVDPL